MLYRLSDLDITAAGLEALGEDPEQLEDVLTFASACRAHAVTHAGAL
ncbi:hypothetical protein EHM94_05580 [Marinobacter sp. NP-6]|nr:hypothetical protein EHM94_05580 [Marinobacter sp. NP-6]